MTPATRSSSGLANQFHALSDETRVRIVDLLRGGEQCVCELTEALDLSQSLLSFHLKTLKDAGLVTDRPEGRWMYYALATTALRELAARLGDLTNARARKPRRVDRCSDRGNR